MDMLYYKSKEFKKELKEKKTMLEQEYFTKEQLVEVLQSATDYDTDSFDDLFNDMFNSDYYIVGKYEAAKALETFKNDETLDGYKTDLDGSFGAIELVKHYETNLFEQTPTPLDDPESVANTVEHIRGEHVFNEALDRAGLEFDSETTAENMYKFIEAVQTL